LDEIGDMSLMMQAKLLRVLEDGSFEPLGSEISKKADVRVISATNRDLKKLIEQGKFREDLYFRIDTVRIDLPPLSERGGDILVLAEYFLRKLARKMNKPTVGLSEEAAASLVAYHWPGNIRELQNVIERALVLTVDEVIGKDDLPGLSASGVMPVSPKRVSLIELEKEHIRAVLEVEGWNMQKTADVLGIHRNTLRQKMKEYDIKSED